MKFDKKNYSRALLHRLYEGLLRPRMIEEKMLILLRQGKISKWFSGIGQEAISVGAVAALKDEEYILPMHRNLGVFTGRNIPYSKMFAQWQGKVEGFTKGRDRSFHFGTNEHHIVGMISHLGPQLSVAGGIALSDVLHKRGKATLVFTGDGGASEGDFHEALNVAAVWQLPVIFVIENNGYGLSTPSNEQFRFKNFVDKGPGYGIKALQVDGNNVLDVYTTIKGVAQKIRKKPEPYIIEAMTFRMRGHEEASGTKYVPKELMEHWAKKDPLKNFESYLLKNKLIVQKEIDALRATVQSDIEEGLEVSYGFGAPNASTEDEIRDMYAPHQLETLSYNDQNTSAKRFVDALSDGLKQSLERFPELVFMGQDVADYGGVFKISEGFMDLFGKERIRNTPLCESAIIGIGMGLSIKKQKAVIEMQFADFVTCGFNQIVNNLAKSHYRWGQNADVVVRMPTGAGVAAGPYHSQSNEAWFVHTPGLKVVYPSSPYDAKGLLAASIEDPNPVLFFEHKALYRSIESEVPDALYSLPIGKAKVVEEGNEVSIITYGMGVHWAQELNKELEDLSIEILDLRTLLPWDKEAVSKTINKTGKVLILHEDCMTGGIGGEIAAWVSEHCFEMLDAPIMREASLDTAVPFSPSLEQNFLPKGRLKKKILQLAEF